jgi:hypothetical protein
MYYRSPYLRKIYFRTPTAEVGLGAHSNDKLAEIVTVEHPDIPAIWFEMDSITRGSHAGAFASSMRVSGL